MIKLILTMIILMMKMMMRLACEELLVSMAKLARILNLNSNATQQIEQKNSLVSLGYVGQSCAPGIYGSFLLICQHKSSQN